MSRSRLRFASSRDFSTSALRAVLGLRVRAQELLLHSALDAGELRRIERNRVREVGRQLAALPDAVAEVAHDVRDALAQRAAERETTACDYVGSLCTLEPVPAHIGRIARRLLLAAGIRSCPAQTARSLTLLRGRESASMAPLWHLGA